MPAFLKVIVSWFRPGYLQFARAAAYAGDSNVLNRRDVVEIGGYPLNLGERPR